MKKTIFLFTLLFAHALHGMEMQNQLNILVDQSQCIPLTPSKDKQSPITLAQTYYHFSRPSHDLLLPEIAQQIFWLQLGTVDLADLPLKIEQKSPEPFVKYLETLIPSCGYLLASELCEYFLKQKGISLCDIQDEYKRTCLHYVDKNPKVAEMLIKIAGDTASTLIAMQTTYGWTALHWAADNNCTEIVTLLLNAAGDKVQDYMAMKTNDGKTAFDFATPAVKKVIKQYMQSNNQ